MPVSITATFTPAASRTVVLVALRMRRTPVGASGSPGA